VSVIETEYFADSPDAKDEVPTFPMLESYKIENVTDMFVSLKLNFSQPLEISQTEVKDTLSIFCPIHQLFTA
jgi:hypothetical protein